MVVLVLGLVLVKIMVLMVKLMMLVTMGCKIGTWSGS